MRVYISEGLSVLGGNYPRPGPTIYQFEEERR